METNKKANLNMRIGPFSLNKAKTFLYLSIDQKFNLPSIVLVQAMKDLLL